MLPQERLALLGMTGVTGVVDGGALQQKVIIAVMRIVTVGTGHFAKTERMAAAAVRFRPGPWVTGETGLLLGQQIKYGVPCSMYLMAAGTGHIFLFVRAAKPAQSAIGFVTIHAYPVLFCRRCHSMQTESPHWFIIPVFFCARS